MADNSNYLSTPEDYATPSQIKSTQDYAKALLYGNMQQPIHHWTQGVSNLVSALVGGTLDYNAAQKEKKAEAIRGRQDMPPNPYPSAPPARSFSEGPSATGTKNVAGDPATAIASIESKGSGDYGAIGPTTKTGDKAYGRYQVMGANIPEWTQATLGKAMTPEEFLQNPQAQDAVFKGKFGEYTAKYGPEGAARAWFAGEKGMNNPNASDINGMTVDKYGKKFAMAFNGTGGQQPPAAQAIDAAAGPPGMQLAASRGAAPPSSSGMPVGAPPMPTKPGQIYVDPAVVPHVPQYSREQVQGMLSNPWATNEQKERLRNEYIRQNQPIEMAYPGGKVLIDPRDPTHQQFIPEGHWGNSKIGDIERPIFLTPSGQGPIIQSPVVHPPAPAVGPQSNASPAAAPTAAPTGAPPIVTGSGPALAENAPVTPDKPIQVASTDPAAAFAEKGAGPREVIPPAPNIPTSPFERFAASSAAPPGVDPQDWAAYTGKKAFDIKQSVNEDSQKKAADFAAKKYDTLSSQAQAARKQMPNLDLALTLMSDPNFHSGLSAGLQDTWARLKAATGIDAMANAPNEAFDKIMAGTILDNMKTALGGLGQVRLAEINLLTKANANRTNTDASNRAVLEVSRRAVQSVDHLDALGQQYASGDEVADPVDGKILLKANIGPDGEIAPRHGLDVGFDKLARKFVNSHPSFTPEEIKRYSTIFETGKDPTAPQTPNEPSKTAPAEALPYPKEAIDQLKANPDQRHFFDETFGPGASDKVLGAKK